MIKIATKNDKPVSIQQIRSLQRKGHSVAEIAEITGISRQAVYQKIKADEKKKGLRTTADEVADKLTAPGKRAAVLRIGDEKASLFVKYHLELFKMGQGCDKKNVPELYERFYNYLAYCIQNNIVPNNMSAYLAIGITYDDIYNWSHGRASTPEHTKFAVDLKAFFASVHEQGATDGLLNPIQTIFWQKAYDGLSDQPKIEVEVNNPLGDKKSAQEIAAEYSEVELPD